MNKATAEHRCGNGQNLLHIHLTAGATLSLRQLKGMLLDDQRVLENLAGGTQRTHPLGHKQGELV